MATYYVMLSDLEGNINWRYPTEIEAVNKQDAYRAIAESCPPESIKAILTLEEYKSKMSSKNVQQQMQFDRMNNTDMSGNDFLNQMLNAAMESAEDNSSNSSSQSDIQQQQTQQPIKQIQQTTENKPKYFTDNGIMFKIENGILYKKCWENVNLTEYTDEDGKTILPEFRIVNIESGKPFKSDKYAVQQLIWKPLNDL